MMDNRRPMTDDETGPFPILGPGPTVVECYAGHAYPERPRAFEMAGQRYNVVEIEKQWRAPEGIAFRVRTEEGRHFTLEYHEPAGCWSVAPDRAHPTRPEA